MIDVTLFLLEGFEERAKSITSDAASDILEHSFCLGMLPNEFPADAFKVIDLENLPSFRLCVVTRPPFVMFRAFALGLIFCRDTNPNADNF